MDKCRQKCALFIVAFVALVQANCPDNGDPCRDSVYEELDNFTRSTAYLVQGGDHKDDYELKTRWYRSVSGAGGDMPTSPVYTKQCNSLAPVWLNGSLPSQPGSVKVIEACVSFRRNTCVRQYSVSVKNCGHYNVYCLTHTTHEFDRYCMGSELPCPGGEYSETGFTPGCSASTAVPQASVTPVTTASTAAPLPLDTPVHTVSTAAPPASDTAVSAAEPLTLPPHSYTLADESYSSTRMTDRSAAAADKRQEKKGSSLNSAEVITAIVVPVTTLIITAICLLAFVITKRKKKTASNTTEEENQQNNCLETNGHNVSNTRVPLQGSADTESTIYQEINDKNASHSCVDMESTLYQSINAKDASDSCHNYDIIYLKSLSTVQSIRSQNLYTTTTSLPRAGSSLYNAPQ